jgi:hypothetical protein
VETNSTPQAEVLDFPLLIVCVLGEEHVMKHAVFQEKVTHGSTNEEKRKRERLLIETGSSLQACAQTLRT